jgi:hypothetical protein
LVLRWDGGGWNLEVMREWCCDEVVRWWSEVMLPVHGRRRV